MTVNIPLGRVQVIKVDEGRQARRWPLLSRAGHRTGAYSGIYCGAYNGRVLARAR